MKKVLFVFTVYLSPVNVINGMESIEQEQSKKLSKEGSKYPAEVWYNVLKKSKLVEKVILANTLPDLKIAMLQLIQFARVSKVHYRLACLLLKKKLIKKLILNENNDPSWLINEKQKQLNKIATLKDFYIQRKKEILKKINDQFGKFVKHHCFSIQNINDRCWLYDDTALIVAIKYIYESWDLSFIKCLLQNGANVNLKNSTGMTALMVAVCKQYEFSLPELHQEIVELLIQHGADINALDENNKTELMKILNKIQNNNNSESDYKYVGRDQGCIIQ